MYAFQTLNSFNTLSVNIFRNWQFSDWKPNAFIAKVKVSNPPPEILRFEISSKKMHSLLANQQICAADIRCLDKNSKQCLQALCLKTCLLNTSSISTQKEDPYD